MRWAALVALVLLAACSGGASEAAAPTATERATTTTEELTPDEAYLEDLRDEVGFTNPQWGDEAIDVAKQVCGTLDAGRDVLDDAATQQYADMTLSVVYETAGEDQTTAAVLVIGAEHFCPEHKPAIEGDAAARGLNVTPSA